MLIQVNYTSLPTRRIIQCEPLLALRYRPHRFSNGIKTENSVNVRLGIWTHIMGYIMGYTYAFRLGMYTHVPTRPCRLWLHQLRK